MGGWGNAPTGSVWGSPGAPAPAAANALPHERPLLSVRCLARVRAGAEQGVGALVGLLTPFRLLLLLLGAPELCNLALELANLLLLLLQLVLRLLQLALQPRHSCVLRLRLTLARARQPLVHLPRRCVLQV